MHAEHTELLYYSSVRWLCRGKTLERFYEVLEHVITFLRDKNFFFDELKDTEWLTDLAFFVDVTGHLNSLNTNLQGKGRVVSELFNSVNCFTAKLRLFLSHMDKHQCPHFPNLAKLPESKFSRFSHYKEVLKNVLDQFESRFKDFKQLDLQIKLFSSPFSIDVETVNDSLQLEVIELQSSTELRDKFFEVGVKEFYKYLPSEIYPGLYKNGLKMFFHLW